MKRTYAILFLIALLALPMAFAEGEETTTTLEGTTTTDAGSTTTLEETTTTLETTTTTIVGSSTTQDTTTTTIEETSTTLEPTSTTLASTTTTQETTTTSGQTTTTSGTTTSTTLDDDEDDDGGIGPGSMLHGLDRAMERISLAITLNKAEKARKGLVHAHERLMEIKSLKDDKDLEKAQRLHERSLERAKKALEELESNGDVKKSEEALEKISELQNKIEEHAQKVAEIKERILERQRERMSEEQIAHLEEVFDRIMQDAGEAEKMALEKRERVSIKHKNLAGLSEEELKELEDEIDDNSGLKEGRKERFENNLRAAEDKILAGNPPPEVLEMLDSLRVQLADIQAERIEFREVQTQLAKEMRDYALSVRYDEDRSDLIKAKMEEIRQNRSDALRQRDESIKELRDEMDQAREQFREQMRERYENGSDDSDDTPECSADSDCDSDEVCVSGECEDLEDDSSDDEEDDESDDEDEKSSSGREMNGRN